MAFNVNGTPLRYISGGRELRQYQGYWYIVLTKAEMQDWPGIHWNGYVLYHKWKWWMHYGEWYGRDQAIYRFLDGDTNNIRITNIGVLERGTHQWL